MQNPSGRRHLLLLVLITCCLLFIVGYTGRLAEQARLEAAVAMWDSRIGASQARQAELRAELDYVRSDAYIHRQAREVLNLVLPGDQLVVLVDEPPAQTDPVSAPGMGAAQMSPPNWLQWIELFFPTEE
ncbi:MAG: septum formation initiator family protein [Caldilineaceae bacterium]|nr:septum formation initiator family protein [Caldilineaceae bacterium]